MYSGTRWTAADVPQHGRTVVVTGASSGLGAQAARVLAGAGARVIMACRDPDKGHSAADRIAGHTEVRRLDLADLSSVRAFADGLDGEVDPGVTHWEVSTRRCRPPSPSPALASSSPRSIRTVWTMPVNPLPIPG